MVLWCWCAADNHWWWQYHVTIFDYCTVWVVVVWCPLVMRERERDNIDNTHDNNIYNMQFLTHINWFSEMFIPFCSTYPFLRYQIPAAKSSVSKLLKLKVCKAHSNVYNKIKINWRYWARCRIKCEYRPMRMCTKRQGIEWLWL